MQGFLFCYNNSFKNYLSFFINEKNIKQTQNSKIANVTFHIIFSNNLMVKILIALIDIQILTRLPLYANLAM